MRGTVLTKRSDPVQVVSVVDDDGNQIAIVGFPPKGESAENGALIGARPLIYMYPHVKQEIREVARAALAERDAQILRVFAGIIRRALITEATVINITGGALDPGRRKLKFSFEHRPVDGSLEAYEVSIRRRRSQRA
jgi:hypothetical protein